jgi:3-deoxy-D-manno-octulosonate 8-phosphate phosphatase (KDO 8-P phosphatase)
MEKDEILYIGDDVVDAWPVKEAGLGFIVGDAVEELDAVADLRLTKAGGHGAVREAIEWLLKEQGKWDSLMTRYFG